MQLFWKCSSSSQVSHGGLKDKNKQQGAAYEDSEMAFPPLSQGRGQAARVETTTRSCLRGALYALVLSALTIGSTRQRTQSSGCRK